MLTPLESARVILDDAVRAHTKIKAEAAAAVATWQAKLTALGAEPPMGKEPAAPGEPTTPRPEKDDAIRARGMIQNAPIQRELHARYERKLAADETAAEAATLAHVAATKRAALVSTTLAAARQAPSDIAREQADLLETARVRFVFPPERTKQTPHVTAEFNHPTHGWIPFGSASSGEQVEASVYAQAKIREMATTKAPAFEFVPIMADLGDYNGGNGPTPTVSGFVLWHVSTAPGTSLDVRPGCPS